jgi:hypothetical protein
MRIKVDSFVLLVLSVIIMIVLIIVGICVNIIKVSWNLKIYNLWLL